MPWDSRLPHAGFSTGQQLWLPQHPSWQPQSAAQQMSAPESTLRLYQVLLALRRSHPAWQVQSVDTTVRHGLWEISRGSLRLIVNTTDEPAPIFTSGITLARSRLDVPWDPGVVPGYAAVLLETLSPDSQLEI